MIFWMALAARAAKKAEAGWAAEAAGKARALLVAVVETRVVGKFGVVRVAG